MTGKLKIDGNDNYGKPRQNFADKLAEADDLEFLRIAEQYIWLSAYASNNSRSDYHWVADSCYDEAARREKPELYEKAYDRAVKSCGG
jgi:hypothetical protein